MRGSHGSGAAAASSAAYDSIGTAAAARGSDREGGRGGDTHFFRESKGLTFLMLAAAFLKDADPWLNAFSLFTLDCSGVSFAISFALFYLLCREVRSSSLCSELVLAKVLLPPLFSFCGENREMGSVPSRLPRRSWLPMVLYLQKTKIL